MLLLGDRHRAVPGGRGRLPLLMCAGCEATHSASGTAGLLEPPTELFAHRDPQRAVVCVALPDRGLQP
jgi:hypothetical protein